MIQKVLLSLFFSFFFLLTSPLISQKDFKPGFIIKNEQDTIYGLINVNSNSKNSLSCEFKKEENAVVQHYKPFDIQAYKIDHEKFYVSKEVVFNDEKKQFFLEYLVNGIVDLFYLNYNTLGYFYIEKGDTIVRLSNNEYDYKNKYGTKYRTNSKQYKGTLKYLFNDSPEIFNKINNTSLSIKPMISLTEDYHNSVCDDYKCINYRKNTKIDISIEPYVGYVYSIMGLQNSNDKYSDNSLGFGVNMRLSSLTTRRFWNYIIGINYSSNAFNGDFTHTNGKYERTHRAEINYSLVKIPLKIEYTFPGKRIQPSILFGYNNIFVFNANSSLEIVTTVDDYTIPDESKIRTYQYGIVGGVGIKIPVNERYSINLNGEYEIRFPGINSHQFFDFQKVSSFSLNLGYCIRVGKI